MPLISFSFKARITFDQGDASFFFLIKHIPGLQYAYMAEILAISCSFSKFNVKCNLAKIEGLS